MLNPKTPQGKADRRGGGQAKQTPEGKVAQEYAASFPHIPTLTIAKILRAKYPELFSSTESARNLLRYYRGQRGEKSRGKRQRADPLAFVSQYRKGSPGDGGWNLPAPVERLSEWAVTKIAGTKALILSDIHIPYHHVDGLRVALDYGFAQGVDSIILDGDILDCYAVSRWQPDPRLRDFRGELEATLQFLVTLREAWPMASIYFKIGNHEERYEAYMRRQAPELVGVRDFELSEVLMFETLGIKMISGRCYGVFGSLPILHGHEFGNSVFNPVNPARGFWLRAKEAMIGGHFHKSSSHNERTLGDTEITVFSVGCLCDLRPDYMPMNSWNLGFAVAEIVEEGMTLVSNRKIVGTRTLPA